MRALPILCAVFLTAATPVFAQVTVDLHALQALPERPCRPAGAVPGRRSATQYAAPTGRDTGRPDTPPGRRRRTAARSPALPETVPQTASINPIAPPEPPAGSPPPPPPPVSATAATKAAPTTAGLRLTFAPEQSDLSPDSSASIKQLAASAPPGDDTTSMCRPMRPASLTIRPPPGACRCRAPWRCAARWSPTACRPPGSSSARWASSTATARPTGWTSRERRPPARRRAR